MAGAEYLASIFGTEKDKVNCSFYFKTGACRHGDTCSRIHNKPPLSQTLLLRNMYLPPQFPPGQEEEAQKHYEEFYEDIFEELTKFGEVLDIVVTENAGQHLCGNTYVKFADEESAQKAIAALNGRFYAGKPIAAEYTPVTDFWEGACKQLEKENMCSRGTACNFLHLRKISRDLERDLWPNGRGGPGGRWAGGGFGRVNDYDDSRRDRRRDDRGYGGGGGGGGGGYRGRRDDRRDDRGYRGGRDRGGYSRSYDRYDDRRRRDDRYDRDRDRGHDDRDRRRDDYDDRPRDDRREEEPRRDRSASPAPRAPSPE